MEPVLRAPANDAETERVWQMICRSFNFPMDDVNRFLTAPDTPQGLAFFVGDDVAAYSRIKSFAMFFGGRSVPTGGYSPVGTAPEYRGRGLASQIVTAQYPLLRERGEVLGALYPATTALYRGVGFEVAGVWGRWKLPTRSLHAMRPSGGVGAETRRATVDDVPEMKSLYRAFAAPRNGHLDRPDWWWELNWEKQFDKLHVYLVPGAGYVAYTQQPNKDWGFTMSVYEVVSQDPELTRALWRMVGTASSMARDTHVLGPPEHPLLLLLPEQDLEPVQSLRSMLRIVDLPGAIAARGYPAGVRASVAFEVEDRHCDWNSGRWQLVVENGEGRLEKAGSGSASSAACMRATVQGLAALYSGYASAEQLAEAGMLSGASDRDLAALSAVFAGPTPWMPDFF